MKMNILGGNLMTNVSPDNVSATPGGTSLPSSDLQQLKNEMRPVRRKRQRPSGSSSPATTGSGSSSAWATAAQARPRPPA